MPIQVLDATVAAQIAAGEVVERPASVIKELLENALDAGARRISVEARGGGLRELKVVDDGCGIPADEVELAFERHATSKLRSADDLWNIGTLGFRGEALPSIASVSQVVCITRTRDEEVGTELRIAGGEVQYIAPRGCSVGTSFSVRNLFYNTPVRREFLRSEATEMSAITSIVQQYALAYPEVRFTLLLDGRLALQTSGTDLQSVVVDIYGVDVARQLLPVKAEYGEGENAISINGLVSPPGITRSSRGYLHIFINRRAVAARGPLSYAIEEAYHTMLMKGRFPLAVIDLRLAPGAVDVNVHPTKSEVKFLRQGQVLGVLSRAVRSALVEGAAIHGWDDGSSTPLSNDSVQRRFELRQAGQSSGRSASAWGVGASAWDSERSRWDAGNSAPQPEREFTNGSSFGQSERLFPSQSGPSFSPEEFRAPSSQPSYQPQIGPFQTSPELEQPGPSPEDEPSETVVQTSSLPPLRIVGQVGLTYIVAEAPEGMYLIDQHAAHERITYERLMSQRGEGRIESQGLLLPISVTLPPASAELLLREAETLSEWGLQIEPWGEGMVRVRAIPATLPKEDLQAALLEIADHLAGRGGSTPQDWREEVLITLSCHTSVRAGQTLSFEEMRQLIKQLDACKSPRTCPHGRPTMILMTPHQIERQFGRA
jgi:DNA mismatch repair protein MutL